VGASRNLRLPLYISATFLDSPQCFEHSPAGNSREFRHRLRFMRRPGQLMPTPLSSPGRVLRYRSFQRRSRRPRTVSARSISRRSPITSATLYLSQRLLLAAWFKAERSCPLIRQFPASEPSSDGKSVPQCLASAHLNCAETPGCALSNYTLLKRAVPNARLDSLGWRLQPAGETPLETFRLLAP